MLWLFLLSLALSLLLLLLLLLSLLFMLSSLLSLLLECCQRCGCCCCRTEAAYNAGLIAELGEEAHRLVDVLAVCDRFETGFDNDAICLVAVDRHASSAEKLVQVYSRANRQRHGKPAPIVLDFQNPWQDVEWALLEFSVSRECLASVAQAAE